MVTKCLRELYPEIAPQTTCPVSGGGEIAMAATDEQQMSEGAREICQALRRYDGSRQKTEMCIRDSSESQPGLTPGDIVPGQDDTTITPGQPTTGNQNPAGTQPGEDDQDTEITDENNQGEDSQPESPGGIETNPTMPESGDGVWIRITEDEIDNSINSGEPLTIEAGEEGVDPLKTGVFSEHDKGLLGENELWTRYTKRCV